MLDTLTLNNQSNKEHFGFFSRRRKKRPSRKRTSRKKKTYKAKKDIPINTNNVIKDDISTNVSEIKLSGTDKLVGSTNDLKTPDMTMNLDLKDDTKFELFGLVKNTNNISTISTILVIFLLIIFLLIIFFII